MKKTIGIFCCLIASNALASTAVDLTINNQTGSVFYIDFKGRDTKISPIDKIKSYETVTITLTTENKYPVGTFILKPDWIGISITSDANLIVTGCDNCSPKSWVTTPIKDKKAKVIICSSESECKEKELNN